MKNISSFLKYITPKSIHSKFLQCHLHWVYTNLIIIYLTFIAVSDTVKVDIVVVIVEEHEGEERVKRVDRNDEENAHNPSLLIGTCVVAKMEINLEKNKQNTWMRKPACAETKPHPGSQSKIPKKNNITDPSLLSDSKEDDQDYSFLSFSHFYCFLICATLPILLTESVR